MRGQREKTDDSFRPTFTNTRSRLYRKKSSSDYNHSSSHSKDESLESTGGYWKKRGNEAFKIQDYDKAIQFYSKAIEMNPGESQYYSNRSKCYQKKRMLEKGLKDAESACELDEKNIKAHYICGCILAELSKNDDSKLQKAENRLKKALRLCRSNSMPEYEEEISIKMFRLKKMMWFKLKEKELSEIKLEQTLMRKALENKEINEAKYDSIIQRLLRQKQAITEPREIPDHLICKITLMLMEEPVVSEDGFTYEKKVLEEHFRLKGPIQPITRKKVEGKFFPNHALKQAIDSFLKQNPWAFEEEKGQNCLNIVFI